MNGPPGSLRRPARRTRRIGLPDAAALVRRRPPCRLASGERGERGGRARRGANRGDADVTRLYIGLGRLAGIRPGDLVGAIANEAGIDARAIGAIDIADRFSIVEVPDDAAENVIEALRQTTIRGKRVSVRRDRFADGG